MKCVLEQLAHGAMSKKDLMRATGLSDATITKALNRACLAGFVADTGLTQTGKKGRQRKLWGITDAGLARFGGLHG